MLLVWLFLICHEAGLDVENEQSMQRELAMLVACQWPSGEAMFPNVETARTVHKHNGRLYHLDRAGCGGVRRVRVDYQFKHV